MRLVEHFSAFRNEFYSMLDSIYHNDAKSTLKSRFMRAYLKMLPYNCDVINPEVIKSVIS